MVSRRAFLISGAAAVAYVTIPVRLPGGGITTVRAEVANYPRQRIGRLSTLRTGEPVAFKYPWDDIQAENILIKLGHEAGGGIGPDDDIVAFNSWCTHQGGPLAGTFRSDPGTAGPCPLHWTTFDLTRHGMVVSGHATQGLPQILLEAEGDDIIATGVMGLIFGYQDNRVDPAGKGA
ncbi:MAG: arsenate reductase (azurin) small subunit [Acidimicrobiia bacterium]|nr:arsenate reductase (azurin) small subunit [Actinomycetota bacterium]MBL6925222.1 arsenate reductase (azurin) small subunit [Acidimicrobiia bacterium]MBL6926707.1 arsenate reductase (azurin) small subunit [Acidimicrobiia bacterium]